ncbi:MurR/RpiR family transcriptional regulator [Parapusillimonas granuli]|uniref:MurR/RpiR family transcriptional regulator n=1 Tax=Parapusillimonas granuli TaxID=380911 RepID=A0A853G583_9BURK|nr:MurR/RpiR family transcriptional regulator [Parapusillimonas granuli]MBB5215597.1 DNA-binding MurR/RpiR family transcriptional regulator [Parapusillimonas granuli]MEB2401032.1 MurR/RpiR family transcriptional regulator [Alcaligenaceae bacterium]NYT49736.1 MurR/RpiR family transcriptional regulator [Parapusillimonas granuli]
MATKTKRPITVTDIQQRIEAEYPNLSPGMQKFARFVLKEPSRIALLPIRQVSELAQVSTSTVIRFVDLLGFHGYQQFRDVYRIGLSLTGPSRYGVHTKHIIGSGAKNEEGDFWSRTTDNLVHHLVDTHKSIQAEELRQISALLLAARQIGVVGTSGIFPAAFYLRYVLSLILDDVHLFEGRFSTFGEDLVSFNKDDLVFIISFDPYAADSVRIAQYCAQHSIPVVALTDSSVSPVALKAKRKIIVPTTSTNFYQTLVPTFAVFEGLLSNLVAEIGKEAVSRVSAKFRRKEELGLYWKKP